MSTELHRPWRTSTYSNEKGGSCVEAAWHKSSYSPNSGNCVEVTEGSEGLDTLVRDTQHRDLGHLAFNGAEWPAFLAEVKADRL